MAEKDRKKMIRREEDEASSAGENRVEQDNPPFTGGTQIISGNTEIEAAGRPTPEGGNADFIGDSVTSVLAEVPADTEPRNRRSTNRERENAGKNKADSKDKDAAA
ncbi:MAG TPA: hypothetical protein VFZ99_03085 [Terriglobales bacterium]